MRCGLTWISLWKAPPIPCWSWLAIIYKMDYRPMLRLHEERDADITVAVHSVSPHETHRFGIVTVEPDGTVSQFEEKPRRTHWPMASMGIYAFRKSFLVEILTSGNGTNTGRDLMPRLIKQDQCGCASVSALGRCRHGAGLL